MSSSSIDAPPSYDLPVTTAFELPGFETVQILGPVFGIMVRSRGFGPTMGAAFKSFAGGELKALSKNLEDARYECMKRLVDQAKAKPGCSGIIAFKFDTSTNEFGTEVCAYGTAVRAVPKGNGVIVGGGEQKAF